jgi:hypothetical protein
MKPRFVLSVVALAILGLFNGCDFLDNLGQVTFDTELSTAFEINETVVANTRNYVANQVLDATANPDIQKYRDRIKDLRINDVSYKITGYTAPAGVPRVDFSNGRFGFGDADVNTASVTVSLPTLNLRDLNTTGAETRLPLPDATTLAALLKTDKRIRVFAEGTLSPTPVRFNLEVKLYVSVTADAVN